MQSLSMNVVRWPHVVAVVVIAAMMSAFGVTSVATAGNHHNNPNNHHYWEHEYPGSTCVKVDDAVDSTYAKVTDPKDGNEYTSVTLKPSYTKIYTALIVNGGPHGDNVVSNPEVGTAYFTPGENNQGKKFGVSHYIVCTTDFDWNWEYPVPTCEYLKVTYPAALPPGQANDVNIKIESDGNEVTLNFHKNEGVWTGTQKFHYADHVNWPGWDHYTVTWVQVGGTNYHWEGEVTCGEKEEEPATNESFVNVVYQCDGTTDIEWGRDKNGHTWRVLVDGEQAFYGYIYDGETGSLTGLKGEITIQWDQTSVNEWTWNLGEGDSKVITWVKPEDCVQEDTNPAFATVVHECDGTSDLITFGKPQNDHLWRVFVGGDKVFEDWIGDGATHTLTAVDGDITIQWWQNSQNMWTWTNGVGDSKTITWVEPEDCPEPLVPNPAFVNVVHECDGGMDIEWGKPFNGHTWKVTEDGTTVFEDWIGDGEMGELTGLEGEITIQWKQENVGWTWKWSAGDSRTITWIEPEGCDEEPTPTPTSTDITTVLDEEDPIDEDITTVLAATGANVSTIAAIAAMLAMLGAGTVVLGRRRQI